MNHLVPRFELQPESGTPNSLYALVFFDFVAVIRVGAGYDPRHRQGMTREPVGNVDRLALSSQEEGGGIKLSNLIG